MQTLTADQFKKKYGGIAASQFDLANKQQDQESSVFDSIKNDLNSTAQQNNSILNQPRNGVLDNVAGGVDLAANTAGGAASVVGDVLGKIPLVGPLLKGAGNLVKSGFSAVTDKLSNTKFMQEAAAGTDPNSPLQKGLEIASGTGQIAGDILGAEQGAGLAQKGINAAKKIPGVVSETVDSIPKPNLGKTVDNLSGAFKDVVPTKQSLIDHNIAKALDLTPGDLTTIESATGNPVGKWLSDNNLIGTNKATTQGLISNFFKTNYDAVRSEIAKVAKTYTPNQVARYTDALKVIQQKIQGVVGLEGESAQVENMLNKPTLSLEDVQTVKEMLDKHFSLYKSTGDVAQGIEKSGLSNVRAELKNFIEKEVKENTGADIRGLNNNVATARTLADAIEKRATRGLTRANITWRDFAIGSGLTYFANPLVGLAAVVIKKVLTSPTARLRFARYLDQLSDTERRQISEQLAKGTVPPEVQQIVGSETQ